MKLRKILGNETKYKKQNAKENKQADKAGFKYVRMSISYKYQNIININ